LIVAGEIDEQRTVELAERLFSDWEGPLPSSPPAIEPAAATRRRIVVVDLPWSTQTELRVAQPGVPRTDPDRTHLGVLNALLGGKFTSRLNLNLRERHGFTYGVSSRFVDRRGPGPFLVTTATASDVAGAALNEILGEIERIRREPAGAEELAETRDYLVGVFPYSLQTAAGLAGRLADLATHGLPDDHFRRALAEIAATDAATVQELARRHLDPETMTIVAAGPQAVLVPQLESFGTVEIRAADETAAV
jgi:zinc protease